MKAITLLITASLISIMLISAKFVSGQKSPNEWMINYGTVNDENGNHIINDKDGNVIFSGSFQGNLQIGKLKLGSAKPYIQNFICKLDRYHNSIWGIDFRAPFSIIRSLSYDWDNNLTIVGNFSDSLSINDLTFKSNGISTSFLLKINDNGKILFSKLVTSTSTPVNFNNFYDGFGNTYISGSFSRDMAIDNLSLVNENGKGFFIAKLNRQGMCESLQKLNLSVDGESQILTQSDKDGNIILLISQPRNLSFDKTEKSYDGSISVLLKYNLQGEFQWYQDIPGIFNSPNNMVTDQINSIYITGRITKMEIIGGDTTANIYGGSDVLSLKYDKNGKILWKNIAGGPGDDLGYGICADPHGNAYVAGKVRKNGQFGKISYTSVGFSDIFVTKINPLGGFEWMKDVGGLTEKKNVTPKGGESVGSGCCIDPFGMLYFIGDLRNDIDAGLKGTGKLKCNGGSDIIIGKLKINQ
jgi:hypothetical protein